MVGCAITLIIAPPESFRSSTAQTVFGSCISDRIPSCIRAPPDDVTPTSGTPWRWAALSHARANFADDASHRAAHEGEVHDHGFAADAFDRGRTDDPSRRPGPSPARPRQAALCTAACRRSSAGPRPEALRVASLLERSLVGELRDAVLRAHTEAVLQCGQTQRSCARRGSANHTGDTCSDEACRSSTAPKVPVLDRDVDSLGHGPSLVVHRGRARRSGGAPAPGSARRERAPRDRCRGHPFDLGRQRAPAQPRARYRRARA